MPKPVMDVITGEKFQWLCDYYIGSNSDLNFNPKIKNQLTKHINIDNYNVDEIRTLTVKNVFCYTHIIHGEIANLSPSTCNTNKCKLINILSNISTPFNIVFHNSDGSFLSCHTELLNIPNLTKIYTQNIAIKPTERIIPIPIGIANSMWKHGDLDIWNAILCNHNMNNKPNLIYFNFNISTNSKKRRECYDVIKSKHIENLPNTDYLSYLKLLSSYKFAICPEGNGLDTHRFWECLYLNVIPICLRNHITEHFSHHYPVVLLDNWHDLNTETLDVFFAHAKWDNYDRLNFAYYINRIRSA